MRSLHYGQWTVFPLCMPTPSPALAQVKATGSGQQVQSLLCHVTSTAAVSHLYTENRGSLCMFATCGKAMEPLKKSYRENYR